jgi:hypothetical protein
MKKQTFALIFGVVLVTVGITMALLTNVAAQKRARNQARKTNTDNSGYKLSGPYTHKNLSIFLLHGANQIEGNILTLQEALAQKKVIVYETKNVNELAIRNVSDEDVYAQAGDIVKGGDQDRMLSMDFIVPPRSGRMPIAAFCVEHGRWSRRGNEASAVFSSSDGLVATKEMKLAAKSAKSQGRVWESVKVAQDKLSENVGTRVNSSVSESSLQLSLENHKVQETAETYVRALSDILNGKNDAIGYVFAINGQINSADVYASNGLFRKLWPKLLKANAVEAIAELQRDKQFQPTTSENIEVFLAEAEDGKNNEEEITNRVKLVTRENDKQIFFETRDRKLKDGWIHRNYIKK